MINSDRANGGASGGGAAGQITQELPLGFEPYSIHAKRFKRPSLPVNPQPAQGKPITDSEWNLNIVEQASPELARLIAAYCLYDEQTAYPPGLTEKEFTRPEFNGLGLAQRAEVMIEDAHVRLLNLRDSVAVHGPSRPGPFSLKELTRIHVLGTIDNALVASYIPDPLNPDENPIWNSEHDVPRHWR